MNEEEIREYIRAKNNPVSNCVGLSRYFIGRHRTSPVYLTLQFEREFNSKMCELEKLKEQLERSEKARKEAIEYINKTKYSDVVGLNNNGIKEFWFVRELVKILDNKGE